MGSGVAQASCRQERRQCRGLNAGLGTPARSPGQPQHLNLCGAEAAKACLHERAGVEQQTMRQEAGNLSSGAISPSFDLGREHTEEASRADPAQGEAPARGDKAQHMSHGCRPAGAGGALTAPELRTPLPAQDHVYPQGLSQPCLHAWLWPPLGGGDVLPALLSGCPGEPGQCLPADSTCQPGSGRVQGSRASSSSPTSHQEGHWLGGAGAPPAPWATPSLWLRAGTAGAGPGSSATVTETKGRGWSQTPCGARDMVT